jgi:hypothetical protein
MAGIHRPDVIAPYKPRPPISGVVVRYVCMPTKKAAEDSHKQAIEHFTKNLPAL